MNINFFYDYCIIIIIKKNYKYLDAIVLFEYIYNTFMIRIAK